jgi:hypothetical protein
MKTRLIPEGLQPVELRRAQVWSDGTLNRLGAVRITTDSITRTVSMENGASLRRASPRTDVDSLRRPGTSAVPTMPVGALLSAAPWLCIAAYNISSQARMSPHSKAPHGLSGSNGLSGSSGISYRMSGSPVRSCTVVPAFAENPIASYAARARSFSAYTCRKILLLPCSTAVSRARSINFPPIPSPQRDGSM